MSKKSKLFSSASLSVLMIIASNVFSEKSVTQSLYFSCLDQTEKQKARSIELGELLKDDQEDRDIEHMSEEEKMKLIEDDTNRRKRVGEIFGEGCFKTSQDYAAAALIYQHGDIPDHFFQTFIWANRAVELGDSKLTQLAALGIDRYLVSVGKKQLFGSQYYASAATNWCYCVQKTEDSFPDSRRKEYAGFSLQDRYDWLESINQGKNCPLLECAEELKSSPQGTIPGFW